MDTKINDEGLTDKEKQGLFFRVFGGACVGGCDGKEVLVCGPYLFDRDIAVETKCLVCGAKRMQRERAKPFLSDTHTRGVMLKLLDKAKQDRADMLRSARFSRRKRVCRTCSHVKISYYCGNFQSDDMYEEKVNLYTDGCDRHAPVTKGRKA